MRFKGKWISIIFSFVFLTSCSNSLIEFKPLTVEDRLSFSLSIPIQNCNDETKFYIIQDKETLGVVNKTHCLDYYCTNINEFDEFFFSKNALLMFFSYFVGEFAIGSELTDNLVTYHFYYPEMEDQVFTYFCYTTIVQKDNYAFDLNKLEFNIKPHILTFNNFNMLQNDGVLTCFE